MSDELAVVIIRVSLVILSVFVIVSIYSLTVVETIEITIAEKEYADNTYLVWSESGEVYRVDDSLLDLRFKSSNDYFNLKQGGTYIVTARGIRVPLLSMYPNIVGYESLEDEW